MNTVSDMVPSTKRVRVFAAASLKIGAKALRSPEDFIRNSSRKLAAGKETPFILS
jgi:DNA topoisomerase VI subunit B